MTMIDIDWARPEDLKRGRSYDQKYSTIHGWVTKMRGTLVGNESVRRQGIREMRAAKAVRKWKREKAAERRKRQGGGGLFSFLSPSPKPQTKAILQRDASHRSTKKGGNETSLHFSHRSNPPRRGSSTRITGQITERRTTGGRGQPVVVEGRPHPRRSQSSRSSKREHRPRPSRSNTQRSSRR